MHSNWLEYINEFKSLAVSNRKCITRLSIQEQQLEAFWEQHSLTEIEPLFTISSPYALSFLYSQLLPSYLAAPNRKLSPQYTYSASLVDEKGQESCFMYVYDCRIFKGCSSLVSKDQNDFVSSFILVYREEINLPEDVKVYQVVKPSSIPPGKWVLKVKESAILRVQAYVRQVLRRVPHRNDKLVLQQSGYDGFMQEWLKFYYSFNIEVVTDYFFKGILILLDNEILLAYVRTLTMQQVYERKYLRPIRVIDKPKNVEQFTLTEGSVETETNWQSLKVTAFRVKYLLRENATSVQCYLQPPCEQVSFLPEDFSEEDLLILQAFGLEDRTFQAPPSLYI